MGADERYRLSVVEAGPSPILRLIHQRLQYPYSKTDPDQKKNSDTVTVFSELPSDNIHWLPEGLVYEEINGKTKLCRISGFRWVQREPEIAAEDRRGEPEMAPEVSWAQRLSEMAPGDRRWLEE